MWNYKTLLLKLIMINLSQPKILYPVTGKENVGALFSTVHLILTNPSNVHMQLSSAPLHMLRDEGGLLRHIVNINVKLHLEEI